MRSRRRRQRGRAPGERAVRRLPRCHSGEMVRRLQAGRALLRAEGVTVTERNREGSRRARERGKALFWFSRACRPAESPLDVKGTLLPGFNRSHRALLASKEPADPIPAAAAPHFRAVRAGKGKARYDGGFHRTLDYPRRSSLGSPCAAIVAGEDAPPGPRQKAPKSGSAERHRRASPARAHRARRSWPAQTRRARAAPPARPGRCREFSIAWCSGNAGERGFSALRRRLRSRERVKASRAVPRRRDDSWGSPRTTRRHVDSRDCDSTIALRSPRRPGGCSRSPTRRRRCRAAHGTRARRVERSVSAISPGSGPDRDRLPMNALSAATHEDDLKISPALGHAPAVSGRGVRYLLGVAAVSRRRAAWQDIERLPRSDARRVPAVNLPSAPGNDLAARGAALLPRKTSPPPAPFESVPMVDVLVVAYDALPRTVSR